MILLHGLFGALSNFKDLIEHFKGNYKVVVPLLPLFDLDIFHTSVGGLEKHVQKFIETRDYRNIHLLGNSLGGHVALVHILKHPERIKSLILTGSSGLFENGMGDSYPKRGDYEYIKKKTQVTFYDPATATKELVDEAFTELPKPNIYLTKKTLRKILRITNRYIKYSGSRQVEANLLIHFCNRMKSLGMADTKSPVLNKLYEMQLKKIRTAMKTLHEDIQYDLQKEIDGL